jgi:hypothetical protein
MKKECTRFQSFKAPRFQNFNSSCDLSQVLETLKL